MVLTAAQTTAFFENEDKMGIPHATVVQLATEGMYQAQFHSRIERKRSYRSQLV
jgi:hypothetical protein